MTHDVQPANSTIFFPFLPNVTAQARGRQHGGCGSVNMVVVGPFEEEEEGTGVASEVVKVKGGDPATPGQGEERRGNSDA